MLLLSAPSFAAHGEPLSRDFAAQMDSLLAKSQWTDDDEVEMKAIFKLDDDFSRSSPSASSSLDYSKKSCDAVIKTECDEDDTVQNPTSSTSSANPEGCDAQQLDIYRDLILRHLIQDISTTCAKLRLPTDPYNWSPEESARWVGEMCAQFSLAVPRGLFLPGRALLSMSQKDFESIAPAGGDTLHAQLQLWKTAFESYHQQQSVNMMNGSKTWLDGQSLTAGGQVESTSFQPTTTTTSTTNVDFYGNAMGYCESQQQQQLRRFVPSPSTSDVSSSSHDLNDEELEAQLCALRGGQRAESRPSGSIHLWHFIRELLDQPAEYGACVRWVDREQGTFKIESSHQLARHWGVRKNRSQMNYDKLSRSLRQYYKKGIIQKPEKKQRLVYKFLPPYHL